jgi:hypothetical protein
VVRDESPRLTFDVVKRGGKPRVLRQFRINRLEAELADPPIAFIHCQADQSRNEVALLIGLSTVRPEGPTRATPVVGGILARTLRNRFSADIAPATSALVAAVPVFHIHC